MEMYETLGIMGEGSYGRVLKCRQRATGRLVAVKKFIDSDHDPGVRRTAQREIHILRGLRHDNLVMLLDAWRYRRRWYLVFEFVERTVLEDLERNPGGLDPGLAKQYLYQILSALAFCHQNNVIHRDVKPENILVSPGGVAKLCDFGFARRVAAASGGRGGYTDYVATRWYRAPELLVGDSHYGKPVDVWAVGCVYVELVTGHALFPGHSDLDQLYRLIRCFERQQQMFYRNPAFSGLRFPRCAAREPLDSRDPKIKHAVLQLLQLCLHMDPELRAQSSDLLHNPMFTTRFVEELLSRIQKERGDCSVLPVRNVSRGDRTEREEGRRTGLHQDLGKREEVEEGDEKMRVKLRNRLNQKPSRPSLEGEGLLAPPSGPEPTAPRPGEKAETHTSMDPTSSESPKTSRSSSPKASEGPETSSTLKFRVGLETASSLKSPQGLETASSLKAPEGPKTSFSLKAPEGPDSSFFPRLQKSPKYTVPLQEP
ncbi:unnamed protein product [Gadus morhua 'NCC']